MMKTIRIVLAGIVVLFSIVLTGIARDEDPKQKAKSAIINVLLNFSIKKVYLLNR